MNNNYTNGDSFKDKYLKYKTKYYNLKIKYNGGASLATSVQNTTSQQTNSLDGYQSDGSFQSDDSYNYDSEFDYESDDELSMSIKEYCKELTIIDTRKEKTNQDIQILNDNIASAKKNIESSNSEIVKNNQLLHTYRQNNTDLEISIALAEEGENRQLLINRQIKNQQDIEYTEGLLKDIEKNQEEKNAIIKEEQEKLDTMMHKLIDVRDEYDTKLKLCKDDFQKMIKIGDDLSRYEANIERFKNLGFKEIGELNYSIKSVKDNEKKMIYLAMLNNLRELSKK